MSNDILQDENDFDEILYGAKAKNQELVSLLIKAGKCLTQVDEQIQQHLRNEGICVGALQEQLDISVEENAPVQCNILFTGKVY